MGLAVEDHDLHHRFGKSGKKCVALSLSLSLAGLFPSCTESVPLTRRGRLSGAATASSRVSGTASLAPALSASRPGACNLLARVPLPFPCTGALKHDPLTASPSLFCLPLPSSTDADPL